MKYLSFILLAILLSCQSNEEKNHAHDDQGNHVTENSNKPSIVKTVWTNKTELFVEFPALVVGEKSRFAAHFTVLEKHQAVKEGSVTVSLIKNNKGIKQSVDSPSSPGIFTPTLEPKIAGMYQLVFELVTPELIDKIIIENVQVFASTNEAIKVIGTEEENGNEISFLKEQAWKMDFQTVRSKKEVIYDIINTSGVWKTSPSDFTALIATTSGIVKYKDGLTNGSPVKKGQVLMTIGSNGLTSNNLSAEISRAKINLDQATFEYKRDKELYELKVVPKGDFEKVEQKYKLAQSNYNTLISGYSSGVKQITAPFNGYIKSLSGMNGTYVEQGAELITITNQNNSLLEAFVSPNDVSNTSDIKDVIYKTKKGNWSSLTKNGGSVLSISNQVNTNNPQLSVFANVKEAITMPEGSFTEVQVLIGEPKESVVIPENCLLEDYGNYSIIVQLSGETFERRPVSIGKRNGELVEITKGLSVNEWIVSVGAFQVKMASMSGQAPAHGHAH
jgi:RND family efflux transporter MFP subunit